MENNNNLEILKSCGAFLEGHFLLSSGKHSSGYCQCAKLLRFPDLSAQVLATVAEQVKNLGITKLVGPAMGGVLVSYELGRQLGLESLFTERKDGIMQLRRGFEVNENDRILITEDVVTTGKSTMETVEALEAFGAKVIAVACIADRRGPDCDFSLPVYSAVKLQFPVYEADDCPLCKEGKIPVVKPGSRTSK